MKNHLRLTRKMLLKLLILTVVIVDSVLAGDVSMDTASNCGMTTDIYDEVFTIRSHASTPNYRCVVTMNTGYSGTHSIEIISENVRITDCGVRLGIYNGSNTDGHQLKIFGCTSHSSGVLYSVSGTVTFELITANDVYSTDNEFLLKVKSFRNT